jgi:hypothetical protein
LVGNYVIDSGNIVSLPNAHFVKVTDTSFGDSTVQLLAPTAIQAIQWLEGMCMERLVGSHSTGDPGDACRTLRPIPIM